MYLQNMHFYLKSKTLKNFQALISNALLIITIDMESDKENKRLNQD